MVRLEAQLRLDGIWWPAVDSNIVDRGYDTHIIKIQLTYRLTGAGYNHLRPKLRRHLCERELVELKFVDINQHDFMTFATADNTRYHIKNIIVEQNAGIYDFKVDLVSVREMETFPIPVVDFEGFLVEL